MSHYSVAVITKTGDIDEIKKLLAPFDENLEVEPYVYMTKEDIIVYAKHMQRKYQDRIDVTDPELANAKTDRDFYEWMHSDYATYDKDGNELSTYNPNAKWDWWVVGGRWTRLLRRKNSSNRYNSLQLKYIDPTDFITYAILTIDGEWISPASIEENFNEAEWDKEYKNYFAHVNPDYYVTIVDCHI